MSSPISLDRFVQELEKLKKEMTEGRLEHGEYDQRLARTINELRERRIDADRATITAKLDELLANGTITPGVKSHLEKRLGLT